MEFRTRDYLAEEFAAALCRSPAPDHPLSPPSPTQVKITKIKNVEFDDPLRAPIEEEPSDAPDGLQVLETSRRNHSKEWSLFTATLNQKFSFGNTIHVSSSVLDNVVARSGKESGKSLADVHMEELDDPEVFSEAEKKVVTRQEYVLRLQQLKGEVRQAWGAGERVKALKLCIKVTRLLMDTSVSQFYPTLFILVVEVMDMLGDLVWERVKRKAEYSDDGTLLKYLPENFLSCDIDPEAKDTCYNWFCKIGSIRELLPRIYLELAISRCWHFLEDDHLCNLQRLTMMMRGLADPLASAYCHLYMAHCAGLLNVKDKGYLIRSIGHITILLERIISINETNNSSHSHKRKSILISLMEPSIEWILKCIFIDGYKDAGFVLAEFGFWENLPESTPKISCVSVVLHYLLKQLPAGLISTNTLRIVELFEQNIDISLDQAARTEALREPTPTRFFQIYTEPGH